MTRFKLTIFLTFFTLVFLKAQIQQGTVPLGGNVIVRQKTADPSFESFTVGISPAAGYFFTDNFGLSGGFSFSKFRNTIDNFPNENEVWDIGSSAVNIFVGARHYFNFLDYRLFGQLDLINQNAANFRDQNEVGSLNIFSTKASIGANAYLSDNLTIEGILKYTFFKNRSYEDRSRVLKGPIEFIADIRPYITTGFGDAAANASEFLEQASWNVGGTAGIRHSLKDNQRRINDTLLVDNQSLELWLQPKFGYFFSDNFLVGMDGGISYSDNVANSPISLAASPYLRYYIRASEGLQVVPSFTFVYNYVQSRQKLINTETVDETFQFIPGLGLHTFIAEGVGFYANGLLNIQIRPDATETALNPRKFTTVQFQIGLEYYLSGF